MSILSLSTLTSRGRGHEQHRHPAARLPCPHSRGRIFLGQRSRTSTQRAGCPRRRPLCGIDEAFLQAARDHLDAAIIDIDLQGQRAFPVADALALHRIPFVFCSGYRPLADPYFRIPRRSEYKPIPSKPEQIKAALRTSVRERPRSLWVRIARAIATTPAIPNKENDLIITNLHRRKAFPAPRGGNYAGDAAAYQTDAEGLVPRIKRYRTRSFLVYSLLATRIIRS